MDIGGKSFEIGQRTFIMGILNITPDSFSDGGSFFDIDRAVQHAQKMKNEGADIIDIGGESTRPNYIPVDADEEIKRIVPVIKAVGAAVDAPISVDTIKSRVAQAALQNGASIVNDVWGLKKDVDMARVIADFDAVCCIGHNRQVADYKNFFSDVLSDLQKSIDIALAAQISQQKIIIDPGIGFCKNYEQNLQTLQCFERLLDLGFPLLVGVSKKSFIGAALNADIDERMEGTLAANVVAIVKGCDFVRVHDVLQNKKAATMTDAIIRKKEATKWIF